MLVFLVFIIFYLLINLLRPKEEEVIEITPTPLPTFYMRPSPTAVVFSGKTLINGIEVNDFTKGIRPDRYGEYLISETENHQILYNSVSEAFLVTVLGTPFVSARQNAEEAFLEILGIDRENACKLQTSLTTPQFANPDFAGEGYALSFCQL